MLAERFASELLGDSGLSILIATVVMTTLIVALGEITPKTLAAQRAVGWSLLVARAIELIMWLETWVIVGFTLLPRLLMRLTGGDGTRVPTITEGELGMLIDIGEAEGVVASGDAAVLRRVLDFGDRQVRDVMTPRTQIVWLEQGTSIREFLATYGEKYHTRFPVKTRAAQELEQCARDRGAGLYWGQCYEDATRPACAQRRTWRRPRPRREQPAHPRWR